MTHSLNPPFMCHGVLLIEVHVLHVCFIACDDVGFQQMIEVSEISKP